jgi:hypothetical protein
MHLNSILNYITTSAIFLNLNLILINFIREFIIYNTYFSTMMEYVKIINEGMTKPMIYI